VSLDDLRKQIDGVDTRIIELLAQRQGLSVAVGQEKAKNKQAISDSKREAAVMSRMRQMAQEYDLDIPTVERIYQCIIAASKSAQEIITSYEEQA